MKLIRENVIDAFNDINILFLYNIKLVKESVKDLVEIEIFNDFIETYNRAYRMILNNKMVDGVVILRSSFELMMLFFGMRIDKNVKAEYCREDSYERYMERRKNSKKAKDYLSPSYLRSIILKKYQNIEFDYMKIYSALSKYAHPTFYRNELRYHEREKTDITIMYLNLANIIPNLFLEVLYEEGLIKKDKYDDISMFRYILDRLMTLYMVTGMDRKGLVESKKYTYPEINKEINKKQLNELKDNAIKTENIIQEYRKDLKRELYNTLLKVEYSEIKNKLLKLGI